MIEQVIMCCTTILVAVLKGSKPRCMAVYGLRDGLLRQGPWCVNERR